MTDECKQDADNRLADGARPTFGHPPLEEVLCGVYFPPVRGLTAVTIGAYWPELRDQYPNQTVQPAIDNQFFLSTEKSAAQNVRCWFSSNDEVYLLQIQSDRFYLNWRKRSSDYPRFHTVLDRFERELDRFSAYCRRTLGIMPAANRFEVAKIDMLHRGKHWSDFDDLSTVLPFAQRLPRAESSKVSSVVLRVNELVPEGELTTMLQMHRGAEPNDTAFVRIETSLIGPLAGETRETMLRANRAVNRTFFDLINRDQYSRFDGVRG